MRRMLVTAGAIVAGLVLGAGIGIAAAGQSSSAARQTGMDDMHGQMSGAMEAMHDDLDGMTELHDAMTPEARDAMHAQMVAGLPDELADEADAMHARMDDHHRGVGEGAMPADHDAHHR